MNRIRAIATGAAAGGVVLVIFASCQHAASPVLLSKSALTDTSINPVVTNCNTTLPPEPPSKVTAQMATSGLPCSLSAAAPFDLEHLQQAFDFNSWLTFAALNEPADGSASGDEQTVWETFQDIFDVMLPDGSAPPPYGQTLPPPSLCSGAPDAHVLRMISKTPVTPTISVAGQPLRTGPLIDQNGHYARYQILINKPMYDYIVRNKLYSKAGQAAFPDSIVFPVGDVTSGTTGTVGAIVIKAAWKVLEPGNPNDDPSRFHTTHAYVYTPAAEGVSASCDTATLGLVGLHIVHKTEGEPQWIWSTFEHADNVPTEAEAANPPAGKHYNFYNAACSSTDCPVNKQPPQPWNPSVQPFPGGFHSQIVRMTKYEAIATSSAANWNAQFQAVLPSSVWRNYELITTQWPTDATNKIDPDGVPFPLFAANSTMETYVQGNTPQASSTCMGCHGNATGTNGKASDFSFVLEKAH